MNLTEYAQTGYDQPDAKVTYMLGSDAYMAWRTGQWLRRQGSARPEQVTSAAGYRVMVDAARIIEVWEDSEPQDVTLTP